MTTPDTGYLMEHPGEATRLATKVNAGDWVDRYLMEPAADARRVLDVGCGPGVIAAELARRFPQTEIVGLDISDARLAEAQRHFDGRPNASTRQSDATNLPFPDESFDLVYSRFLLEYLPGRQQAVDEMARVCRPGGRVMLHDLDGQLVWHYPIEAGLQADIEKVLAAVAGTGFDPYVGRKLFSLARGAGLCDTTVHVEPYHLIAGAATAEQLRLWELKLEIARPAVAQALGSADAADDLMRRFLDYLRRDDTLTYSILFTVCGTKGEAW
jgi:SAM-dependent methyltransferase